MREVRYHVQIRLPDGTWLGARTHDEAERWLKWAQSSDQRLDDVRQIFLVMGA